MNPKEPNQGEGDRVSARRYNRDLRDFISEGRVEPAAREAERFVEAHPADAERAERKAKHGPMGWLERTVESIRAVLHRK